MGICKYAEYLCRHFVSQRFVLVHRCSNSHAELRSAHRLTYGNGFPPTQKGLQIVEEGGGEGGGLPVNFVGFDSKLEWYCKKKLD